MPISILDVWPVYLDCVETRLRKLREAPIDVRSNERQMRITPLAVVGDALFRFAKLLRRHARDVRGSKTRPRHVHPIDPRKEPRAHKHVALVVNPAIDVLPACRATRRHHHLAFFLFLASRASRSVMRMV